MWYNNGAMMWITMTASAIYQKNAYEYKTMCYSDDAQNTATTVVGPICL
jgi:hypothetical protein